MEGIAYKMLEGLEITAQNYEKAVDLLKTIFGQYVGSTEPPDIVKQKSKQPLLAVQYYSSTHQRTG